MPSKKIRITISFFIASLIISMAILHLNFKVTAPVYPQLSVSPQESYVLPGQEFNVSVTVSGVNNLYLYQVYMNFSSEILEVKNVIKGEFLSRGTYNTFWQPKWDNTKGIIQIWESMLRPDPPTSGSGELFKITLKTKKAGSSTLHLYNTQLIDQFQAKITHTTKDGLATTLKVELNPKDMRGKGYTPGNTVLVNVTLLGAVEKLYGFNLRIKYNNTIIKATSATILPLLAMPNENYTIIDDDEGLISLNVTCKPGAPSTNKTGQMATLAFYIKGFGETFIEISSKLVDVDGKEILHIRQNASLHNVFKNIGIIPEGTSLSPPSVVAGENITLTLKVFNNGASNETFTVIVYAKNKFSAVIAGPLEFSIEKETSKTLEISLSTNGLEGNYTVNVVIPYVPGEEDFRDNEYKLASPITVRPQATSPTTSLNWLFYITALIIVVIVAILIYNKVRKSKVNEGRL